MRNRLKTSPPSLEQLKRRVAEAFGETQQTLQQAYKIIDDANQKRTFFELPHEPTRINRRYEVRNF